MIFYSQSQKILLNFKVDRKKKLQNPWRSALRDSYAASGYPRCLRMLIQARFACARQTERCRLSACRISPEYASLAEFGWVWLSLAEFGWVHSTVLKNSAASAGAVAVCCRRCFYIFCCCSCTSLWLLRRSCCCCSNSCAASYCSWSFSYSSWFCCPLLSKHVC